MNRTRSRNAESDCMIYDFHAFELKEANSILWCLLRLFSFTTALVAACPCAFPQDSDLDSKNYDPDKLTFVRIMYDSVGGNGEAARRSVVPLGALIAFVGGTDEHGGLGATAIDFCAFEWCSCERFGRESNGIGMRAFALFEPVFAAEGAITFFCQGRSRGFKLLEYLKIIDGTIDV